MKNLKKVLALVLAFACAFTMFAGAVVYPDVAAGSEFSEAVTMLSDLGIIQGKDDGKYHPEDTITRAEACALIARMLTGDPQVTQYAGAANFTDVVKGSWKESVIGYCVVNGITVGVGNNKFEPDRAITDAEFVTMVVRAMGYETTGTTYPYGHISAAQANGLLEGVSVVPSSAALRGEDAQIMYNALFADYARGAKMTNTTHGTTVEEYDTIAHAVFGLDRAAVGEWGKTKDTDNDYYLKNCKAHTWVIVGKSYTEEGAILAYPISDKDETDIFVLKDKEKGAYEFQYEGDISGLVGYKVELWGEGDHGEPEWDKKDNTYTYSDDWTIKAIKTVKGQTAYDYNASMADDNDDNGSIKTGDIDVDLESVADNADVVDASLVAPIDLFIGGEHNGVEIKKNDENVEKALNVRDADQYKLVDWDSDGDVDWIVVDEAKVYKVENATSKRAAVVSMKAAGTDWDKSTDEASQTWKLDGYEDGKKANYNGFDKDFKVEYKADGIEEGSVVEVTASFSYNKGEKKPVITYTVTEIEAETAELDKVSTKGGLQLTFDGDVKKIAQNEENGDVIVPENPEKYEDFDDEELGTAFALYMNRNGFIVYSDYSDDNAAGYLMVLDTTDGRDTLPRKNAKIDAMLGDGTYKTEMEVASDLKLDQTLTIDGDKYDAYEEDAVSGKHPGRHFNEPLVVGHVYKYYTDSEGVITKMKPVADDHELSDYEYDADKDRLTDTSKAIGSLDTADVLFAVAKNYIRYDDATNVDATIGEMMADGGLFVDKDDVLAVKQEDIPDIDKKGAGKDTNAVQLNDLENLWIAQNADAVKYDIDDNKEISAAILGVDSFDYFNNAAVKVGLVTAVSASGSDKNVTVDLAYDGKVEEDVAAVEKLKVSDIFETADGDDFNDVKAVKAHINADGGTEGMYAEVSFNNDGKITKVVFMDEKDTIAGVNGNDRTVYYGKSYKVERAVVNQVKTGKWVSILTNATFYDKENFYSLDRVDDAYPNDMDLADDAKYYTFNKRPSFGEKKVDLVMDITNGFMDDYKVEAGDENDLVASDINNKFDDTDNYVTADLVSKKADDGDVVAAYIYDDMGEKPAADHVVLSGSLTKVSVDGFTAVADQVLTYREIAGGAKVHDVEVTPANKGVSAVLDTDNNKVTVSVDADATAGTYKVALVDANDKVLASKELVVESKDAPADITAAKQAMDDAKAELDEAKTADEAAQAEKAEAQAAQDKTAAKLTAAQDELTAAQTAYDTAYAADPNSAATIAAEQAVKNAQSKVDAAKSADDDAKDVLTAATTKAAATSSAVTEKQTAYDTAKNAYDALVNA